MIAVMVVAALVALAALIGLGLWANRFETKFAPETKSVMSQQDVLLPPDDPEPPRVTAPPIYEPVRLVRLEFGSVFWPVLTVQVVLGLAAAVLFLLLRI